MSWKIVFFESARGERPVGTFIDSLDEKTESKVFRSLDLLRNYGSTLMMPHAKKISAQLYELRIRGRNEIRIFYTFRGNAIYLLHAFQKKSQKIPNRELETAENRLKFLN
ncbi:type II toxin-antitoxin system RelE/ParE family toxin [Candidatus Berkelbacteria bacterium]|nr:type II toxin-antitoxin system RelE/ParE family toxin [Candidatus Berkelbacteria bacterium]